MTKTMVSLTGEELSTLKKAAAVRFGKESRISRGGMIRLMAEETIDEYTESDDE
jgi:hypothetical protein